VLARLAPVRRRNRPFPVERAPELEGPGRFEQQPVGPVLAALELGAESRLLDLGAGTGYFALPAARVLADAGGGGLVLAADLQARMLQLLRKRARRQRLATRVLTLHVAPAWRSRVPLEAASVDRALLANVFLELVDPAATLTEVRRVLSPGGLLVVVDWERQGSAEAGPPRSQRPEAASVEEQVARAGFDELERRALSADAFLLRARR